MLYIWIAITSHLLFAINSVIDKFLLHEKRIGHPASYAFAIGILSLLAVALVPFGFFVPSVARMLLALTAGALFTFSLLTLFMALKAGEASRVVPVVGGFVAFFTLVFAFVLVDERLLPKDLLAFVFLVLGMILMAGRNAQGSRTFKLQNYAVAIFAAILFGLSFALTKMVFNQMGFINGLIWTRFGMGVGALLLLLPGSFREAILSNFHKEPKEQRLGLFITGQAIGALAGVAQNYAIALGSVSIVNALQGTQFVFLFFLTTVLSVRFPNILREEVGQGVLIRKIAAIIVISLGVVVLAV